MRRVIGALVFAIGMGAATSAHAANYNGKLELVQNTATSGTLRFLTTGSPAVSLFATGDFKTIMLQALFNKIAISAGYTVSTCPPGITGTCGKVTFISVSNP